MKYKLICDENNLSSVVDLIESYGFRESNEYDILFIENKVATNVQDAHFRFLYENLETLEKFLITIAPSEYKVNRMVVKHNESYIPIEYKEIKYIKAGNNCSYLYSPEEYKVNLSLHELEIKLKCEGFIRINKSEIVNVLMIDKIDPWFSSRFIIRLYDGNEFVVTKSYYKLFKRFIGL